MNGDDFLNRPTEAEVRALRDRVFGPQSSVAERVQELTLLRFVAACMLAARDRGMTPRDYWAAVKADVLEALIDRQIETDEERQLWEVIQARLVDAMEGG
jgi:hypothetical protein